MRALLVVNEQATTTSERSRDVLVRALRSAADLQVAYTRRRGHATWLVRQAAAGVELVVTHGGDGTVNEVVNGLMAAGTGAADRPALAVVPGGSTNVFARAVGLPRDWAEATGVILEALRADNGGRRGTGGTGGPPDTERTDGTPDTGGTDRTDGTPDTGGTGRTDGIPDTGGTGSEQVRTRTIGLGRADERYFTFCAGLGLDAAVVRRVEQARFRGRTPTPARYARATVRQLLSRRDRHPPGIAVELAAPDQPGADQLATVIVQNTAPWTYLGDRPIDPNPDASFDLGLDVLALRALRVPGAARTFGQLLAGRAALHGRQVVRWHDLSELALRANHPQPFQVDGDYLGERDKVQLTAVPRALRVVC